MQCSSVEAAVIIYYIIIANLAINLQQQYFQHFKHFLI